MAFNIEKDHYVIVNHSGKNKLALVTSVSKSTVSFFLNEELQTDGAVNSVKAPIELVIADLGPKPKVGNAYGVKIDPFYSKEEHPQWGTIFYFRLMQGKEKKFFRKSLDRTIEFLEQKRLAFFLPLDIKVHESTGKYLGYYKHSNKDGVPSIMGIQPPTFEIEPDDLDYIIYHEAAHAMWFKSIRGELRAKWVLLFEKRIKCKHVKQKDLDRILEALYVHSENGVKDFIKNEASDEEQLIITECLSYLKKVYKLSVLDVDNLLKDGERAMDEYWPTLQDVRREVPDVSLYSMNNCEEMFAECMAFLLIGNELPKDVRKLLKETIAHLRSYD